MPRLRRKCFLFYVRCAKPSGYRDGSTGWSIPTRELLNWDASSPLRRRRAKPRPKQPGSQPSTIDPAAFRIGYVWINPGLVAAEILIQLTPAGGGETKAHIRYRYTGLSAEGNAEVERYDENWFETKMKAWEAAINHYLRTGQKIAAAAWE